MPPQIIDTHVHIWNLEKAKYAWLQGDTTILNRTYDIDELGQSRVDAHVSEGIFVQSANNFEDTDWMLQVARQTGWIKSVVAWLPLLNPALTYETITNKYKSNSYIKGIRHLIHNETDASWLLQEPVLESLAMVAQSGLSYDIVGIVPAHIETALQLAEKLPDLWMVFDHLNQPPIATKEQFGKWGELMLAASKHPNLYCKISGLGTASGNLKGWVNDDFEPYVNFVLEHFGTDRCFCGGDWPVSLLAGSYERTWHSITSLLEKLLSPAEQSKVLYGNAKNFYRL